MARAKNGADGHLDEAMVKLTEAHTNLEKELKESHSYLEKELKESKLRWEQGQTTLRQSTENLLQAQTHLAQAQAAFMQEQSAFRAEVVQRFQRIESILLDHIRIMERLPEEVREKIGFKAPPK